MAALNISIEIAAKDAASGVLGGITRALGGLGDIAGGAVSFALGGVLKDAFDAVTGAAADFLGQAMQAEVQQVDLARQVGLANAQIGEQAAAYANASGQVVSSTRLSADALGKLNDQYTHAHAKLDDMEVAYRKLKHPTESQTLALEDQRAKVSALTDKIAAGSQVISTNLVDALHLVPPAAGFTVAGLNALAQKYKDLVGGSDEAVTAIEQVALKAGSVSADQMPQFIQRVADLGAVMHDNGAAALLLARAYEDPGAAMTKANKAGILFDDSLKEQIKTLIKHNDTAGATKLVLDRIAQATAGAAAANANTLSGRIEILKNHFADMGKGILEKVLPGLESLFDTYIAPGIPVLEHFAGVIADGVGPAMRKLVGFVELVVASFQLWGNDVPGALNHIILMLTGQFMPNLVTVYTGILTQVGKWAKAFIEWIAPMIPPFLLEMGKLEIQWITWLAAQVPPLIAQLVVWGRQLWAWVAPMIPPLLAEAQKLAVQLWAWVQAQVPPLIAQLQAWGRQFIAWVAPFIPPLIAEAQKLAGQLWAWIVAQVPPLLAQLLKWGQQFVAWVGPQIPPLLTELGLLAAQLWAWIVAQVPPLINQLLAWGAEFVNWVGPQIPPLLAELGKLLGQLSAWAWGTALPEIITQIAKWAVAFMDWVMKPGGAKDQVLPELGKFLLAVGKFVDTDLIPGFIGFAKNFVGGLVTGLTDSHTVQGLVKSATDLGNSVMDGIKGAINGAIQGIIGAAVGAVQSAIDAAKAAASGGTGNSNWFPGQTAPSGGHRAGGGPVVAGRPYLVGELGPELFVPLTGGTILSTAQIGARGGPATVNNYTINATYRYQPERALVDDIRQRALLKA